MNLKVVLTWGFYEAVGMSVMGHTISILERSSGSAFVHINCLNLLMEHKICYSNAS